MCKNAFLHYNSQMAERHWLGKYLDAVGGIVKAGGNTEGTYRTPIQNMLEEAAIEFGASVNIRQEPGRIKDIGAPDFLVSAKGGGVVGYVECKAPGADLQHKKTMAQVQKYRALSENILLTDCYRWMHLRAGKNIAEVRLPEAKLGIRERDEMSALLRAFMTAEAERVADSKQLATALAYRCGILRKGLLAHENDDKALRLHNLLGDFQKALDRDLDFARFADIFAQTLVYSLLMAKLNAPDGVQLELDTARRHIPENFAVIRQITTFLPELEDAVYEDIRRIVGDILTTINGMDRAAIAASMSYKKGVGEGDDPYLNFYEDFLAKYDAKLRKSRGVYYTPPPVVRFIVRAADDLLRRDFDMPEGLAESGKITALDFAAGTGTFMLEMARLLLDGKSGAGIDMLARGHFLKNFYGFEMMTSAYVISHLKLSRFLADNGIELRDGERIQAYLANTLERIDRQMKLASVLALADDAKSAEEVKNKPVLVIVGNPPYSGHSQNKSEEQYERDHKKIKGKRVKDTRDTWIGGLLRGFDDGENVGGSYYEVDGEPLRERTVKWIQDDYVKFIRFAQHKMHKAGKGVVAIITNHSFLDNPTFRGMRQSLMKTFDALYFLDLHGNSKKKERAPDGGKDENVFDIQQGVAVSLLVKSPAAKKKGVFHANMWGLQKDKHANCDEYAARESGGIDAVEWAAIKPAAPFYLFVPRDTRLAAEYDKFYSVNYIFGSGGSGITTAHDGFVMDFDASALRRRFEDFRTSENNAARLHEQFNVAYKKGWDIMRGKKALAGEDDLQRFVQPISYRPFDARHIFYENNLVWRTVRQIMNHMLAGDNVGLVTVRQVAENAFNHAVIVNKMIESRMTISNKGGAFLFPLYRYEDDMGAIEKRENFTADFRQWINDRYGEAHTPENILGCIYAILHSPDYRRRYADFLRIDFPRIPFPESNDEFKRLAAIGNELIAAHLLRENCTGELAELRGDGTSHKVENVHYDENGECLHFNKGEFFAPIPPEVFNFHIGGYKPLDKYLKSRKGRKLSITEADTIKKAANAIAYTIAKIGEIDE